MRGLLTFGLFVLLYTQYPLRPPHIGTYHTSTHLHGGANGVGGVGPTETYSASLAYARKARGDVSVLVSLCMRGAEGRAGVRPHLAYARKARGDWVRPKSRYDTKHMRT